MMKNITVLVTAASVMIVSSATSVNRGFFTLDCVSKDLAFLCIDTSVYDVALPPGCNAVGAGGNYSLTTPCFGNTKVLVVFRKLNDTSFHLTGGRDTRLFTVTCEEKLTLDGAPATVTTVVKVHADATHDHVHVHVPVTGLTMLVTTEDPSESSADLHPVTGEVNLGQKMFLVIRSKKSGQGQFFLPRQCTAKSDPPLNLTLTLWNSTSTQNHCIDHPSLADQFTIYKNGRRGFNLAFLPVYAFYFQQMYVHDNVVTYTCSFTVCPDSAGPGYCNQELHRMSSNKTQCVKQGLETARKRRDVQLSPTWHTSTLSVTIRIRNFNLGQAKEGSSSSGDVIIAATGGVVVSVIVVVVVCAVMLMVVTRRRNKCNGRSKRATYRTELTKF
ncbi:uncharacterized protein [Haliotis asinina]|uniref:uncharacterized protein n=1 Tax=Haliotis asinina TaxID=109174 RepID=UPI003532777D